MLRVQIIYILKCKIKAFHKNLFTTQRNQLKIRRILCSFTAINNILIYSEDLSRRSLSVKVSKRYIKGILNSCIKEILSNNSSKVNKFQYFHSYNRFLQFKILKVEAIMKIKNSQWKVKTSLKVKTTKEMMN